MRYNSFLHIFPEQCAEYLKKKFRMHSNLTVRELMVILKHIGIKTVKVHANGKIYDVFSKRDIDGILDFEFLNNLHEYRRIKQIRDEWNKEPLIDYTPEMSDMKNASNELLRLDGIYINENKNNKHMNQDNKKLYESIMASVAKEVKKALNESEVSRQDIDNAKAIAYAIMILLEYAAADNGVSLINELDKRNIYPSLDSRVIYTMAQTIMDLVHIN